MDAKARSGLAAGLALARRGWTEASFKPGEHVTVNIHPLKNGSKGGPVMSATFADGRVLVNQPGG